MAIQTFNLGPLTTPANGVWVTSRDGHLFNTVLTESPSTRYFTYLVLSPTNGRVDVYIDNTDKVSGTPGHNLSQQFEDHGRILVESGDQTVILSFPIDDKREPYGWIPTNADEVIAFMAAYVAGTDVVVTFDDGADLYINKNIQPINYNENLNLEAIISANIASQVWSGVGHFATPNARSSRWTPPRTDVDTIYSLFCTGMRINSSPTVDIVTVDVRGPGYQKFNLGPLTTPANGVWVTSRDGHLFNRVLTESPSTRYFTYLVLSPTNGRVDVYIDNTDKVSGTPGHNLSQQFEDHGYIIVESGDHSIRLNFPIDDKREPYGWIPTNADEVIAFMAAYVAGTDVSVTFADGTYIPTINSPISIEIPNSQSSLSIGVRSQLQPRALTIPVAPSQPSTTVISVRVYRILSYGNFLVVTQSPNKVLSSGDGVWYDEFDLPSGVTTPTGIAVDINEDILFIDVDTRKIYRRHGNNWDTGLSIPSAATSASGLIVDTNGDILFVDATTRRIYRYSKSASTWDTGFSVPTAATFPTGLAIASNGDILIVNFTTLRVYRYSKINSSWDRGFVTSIPSGGTVVPIGLAIDVNDDILFIDAITKQIYRYVSGSWTVELALPNNSGTPQGLAVNLVIPTSKISIAIPSQQSSLSVGVQKHVVVLHPLTIAVEVSVPSTVVLGVRVLTLQSRKLTISVTESNSSSLKVGVNKSSLQSRKLSIFVIESHAASLTVGVNKSSLPSRVLTISVTQSLSSTLVVNVAIIPAPAGLLQLSNWIQPDATTLEFAALLQRTLSGGVYYRDSDRGGTDSPLDGNLNIGPDNTRISQIQWNGSVLVLNDSNEPSALVLSSYFGSSGAGRDITFYVQRVAGVTQSFSVETYATRIGGNFIRLEGLLSAVRSLFNSIATEDRWILAATHPAIRKLSIAVTHSLSSSVSVGVDISPLQSRKLAIFAVDSLGSSVSVGVSVLSLQPRKLTISVVDSLVSSVSVGVSVPPLQSRKLTISVTDSLGSSTVIIVQNVELTSKLLTVTVGASLSSTVTVSLQIVESPIVLLQLSHWMQPDGTALEFAALLQRTESGGILYKDSDRGGTDSPLDGNLNIGPDNTRISQIQWNGSALIINDSDEPEELTLSTYFGASGAGRDITFYVQRVPGVTQSFSVETYTRGIGGGFIRFDQFLTALVSLLDGIATQDRWILAATHAASQKLTISVVDSLSSAVRVGVNILPPPPQKLTIIVQDSLTSSVVIVVGNVDALSVLLAITVPISSPSALTITIRTVKPIIIPLAIHLSASSSAPKVGVATIIARLGAVRETRLPQIQVVFDGDRFRWADHFDERAQSSSARAFIERIFPQSRITEKLPDPFRAILADKVATISCSNTINADDAWRSKTTTQIEALHSSEVSFNEVVLLNRLRQRRVSVTLRDHAKEKDLMTVKGFMSRISRKANRGSFTITGIDRNKLKVKIPTVSIADAFPAAVEYNSAITNESVRVVFGQVVRMKIYRLTEDHSTFGPIDLSVGGIGSLTLQSVYRNGMIVPSGQYKLTTLQGEGGTSYGVIQFLNEFQLAESAATQQSASPSIQVDVLNVEFKQNHARAIRWAVQAAGFAIDTASFDAAETKFTALSYVAGGAITKRKVLEDVLRELLVRGAYLTQIETSTDSATVTRLGLVVDEASNHPQINDLDILWTDQAKTIEEVTDFSEKEFADIPKTFKIEGYFDEGVGGDVNGWRMSAVKTNSAASEGRDIEVTNSFIYDPDTLRSECDYRAKRLFSDVAALKVAVIPRLSGSLKLARTINTELFPLGVYSSLWMITELEYNAGKYLAQLTPYDQEWYTYSSNNLAFTSNVNFNSISDFSHTRPSRPTGFELNGGMAALLVVGDPGSHRAIAPLRADAPAANATNIDSLVFSAFVDGESFPFLTEKVPVRPNQQDVSVVMVLQPNVTYDFDCHAYKDGNFYDTSEDYRESFRATINNVTTPEPSILATGFRWRGAWLTLRLYLVGDVTTNGGIAWVCVLKHTSATNAPTEANSGGTYWEIFTNKGTNGRGIVSTVRRENFIIVTYSDGTMDSLPIRDGKPGLPGPSASFRWNNRIDNTSSGTRPTSALVAQIDGGWALSAVSGSSLPTAFAYSWSFLVSSSEKVIWFNGIPSVPDIDYAEFFNQTVADPGGNTGIGDIITIQNATNPQEQWADFEVKGIVKSGLDTSKWWGLRVAFYGDSVTPNKPLDLTQLIIRFSRVLQPPSGEGFIGPPVDNEALGTAVLTSRVQLSSTWKTILTRSLTLTSAGAITVNGEFIARVFGQGTITVQGRVRLIQGTNTHTGAVQSYGLLLGHILLQQGEDFIMRAIPSVSRELLVGLFTAELQARYVTGAGTVLQPSLTTGIWFPRVSSANLVITSGDATASSAAGITTTTFTGYQKSTSAPATPSDSVETPPATWVNDQPDATATEGVYRLEGTRTYRNNAFVSAVWIVTSIAPATTGAVTNTTVTGYRRGTSAPSAPSNSIENLPSGWNSSQPSATATENVYRLRGVRSYRRGSFVSAVWVVTQVTAALGESTTSTTVSYRRGTSAPNAPSSSLENAPLGWLGFRPSATQLQGVYSLTGVRTYRDGEFVSTAWTVTLVTAALGSGDSTTSTVTGYRRATSTPSTPSSSTEDLPSAWDSSQPNPTRTQGVYRLRGRRTYRDGEFVSAAWSVSLVAVALGEVVLTTTTVTGYRRSASTPSEPSSSTTSLPSAWDSSQPSATTTQGVYRLVGRLNYRNGTFFTSTWVITLITPKLSTGTVTTSTVTGYRRATSTPSTPISRRETLPSGWVGFRPGPTVNQDEYSLVGVRTYRGGVFQSASWTVTLTRARTGGSRSIARPSATITDFTAPWNIDLSLTAYATATLVDPDSPTNIRYQWYHISGGQAEQLGGTEQIEVYNNAPEQTIRTTELRVVITYDDTPGTDRAVTASISR